MKITELLAKSDGTTLKKHTEEVVEAARVIKETLRAAPDMTRSAFIHDLGKGCFFFQQKMYGKEPPQWHRHEIFSLLVGLNQKEDSLLSHLELAAIATHHKNLNNDDLKRWTEQEAATDLRVLSEQQFPLTWGRIGELFGSLPTRLDTVRVVEFIRKLTNEAETSDVWSPEGRALAYHRAALVAADHLASSGAGVALAGDNLTADAVAQYAREKIANWSGWKTMQEQAQASIGNALLTAPTGAGKTEAALLWAIANRKRGERIFYVLPYQVSINAMAQRLNAVFPAEDGASGALHANDTISVLHSNTDLAYLQDAMDDEANPKESEEAGKIAQRKREAARKIYSPVKVTTVYQLLDIFFGRKFFEVGLLELTNSLVIFDEIHAYDGHTMGLILVLLECLHRLGARVFIMTATLPTALKNRLQDAAYIAPEQEIALQPGDPLLAEVRREITCHDKRIEDLIPEIREAVKKKKKTAVVCNTVDKAISLYDALIDLEPLLVHSRFTFGDRAERETKENIANQKLVISTQVIEVSLDVSFDFMFTELAPADSLLQRFGRVNRHGKPEAGKLGQCHIACADDDGSGRVYDKALLAATHTHLLKNDEPLDFTAASRWIEAVYPDGLTAEQNEKMKGVCQQFQDLIDNLRPMLDPLADVELEMTLFDSVQVVPVEFEKEWLALKEQKRHMEARRLMVNVSRGSWQGALKDATYFAREGCRNVIVDKKPYIIALFEYKKDKGLLLKSPERPDVNDQFDV